MNLSLKNKINEQNKKCPTKIIFTPVTTSYFSPSYCHYLMSNLNLQKTDSRPLPEINPKIKDIDTSSINSPDPVFTMAHTSTNYQSMSNLHSVLYLSMTASDSLVEKPKFKEDETPTYIKHPDIVNPTESTSHFTSPNYQSMSNSHSNLYLSKIPSESSGVEKPKFKEDETPTYIKHPDIVNPTESTSHFTSPNYQSMSNSHSNLYLSKIPSESSGVEKPKIRDIETPTYINSPDIVYPMTTTSHFASSNYQSLSNLYLSGIPSESSGVEKPKIRDIETPTYINSPDIVYPMTTTSHFASSNYQSMSNLYLSGIPSESSGVEKPKIRDIETPTYINAPDIVYPMTTISHYSSSNFQSMSNLYLSGIASESLGAVKPKIRDVETSTCITYIKPPDTVYPTVTTSIYSSSNFQSMSNLYLSGIASESLGAVKPKIRDVATSTCITYIKPPDTVCPTVTTSHYSSSNFQSMSNLYLSGIPSESSGLVKPKIRDVETPTYIEPTDSIYPMQTTSYFPSLYSRRISNLYSNLYLMMTSPESLGVEKPKFRLIKTFNEANPFDSLLMPETTSHSPSTNDQGISPKVIDYVLKCKKSVADQSVVVVNRKEADTPMCSINKNNSVNYDTTSENNQMPLEVPSIPNTKKKRKQSNILLKSDREMRKCLPSIPTSRLQRINKKLYEESLKIYNFSKTNGQIESTSNNEQNDFPQISYPTIQPSNSIDEKYSSGTLSTQLKPHPTDIEIPEKSEMIIPYYGTSTISSLQVTNKAENDSFISKNAQEMKHLNPPVSFNKLVLIIVICFFDSRESDDK